MPGLNFPVRADTSQFDQTMERARNTTSVATRFITQQFTKMARDMVESWATSGKDVTSEIMKTQGAAIASWVAIRVAWVAAAGLAVHEIIALIGTVREQMQQVVELADKANGVGVTPAFWQAWVSGARNGRVEVEALEQALQHAGDVTKDKLNPDWTAWDDGVRKAKTGVEKMMVEMREMFTTAQNFSGLQLFRDARDTEGRTRAVLTYMIQLQAIGQDLAALELGEKMFGAKFVENIRQGNTSAQQMLDALKTAPDWSNEVVARAKDIDVALRAATDHLNREMHPAYESLVALGNELKSTWVTIVEWIAKGAALIGEIDSGASKFMGQFGPGRLIGGTSNDASPDADAAINAMRQRAASRSALAGDLGINDVGIGGTFGGSVPMPKRRPSDAPKKKKEDDDDDTDAFESATDAINRQIAALTADAAAVGKTAAEHQQLRVEMRLLEAARQSGVEITDKQIAEYAQLRASMGAEQALAAAGIKLESDQAATFAKLSANIRVVATALEDKKRAFQGVNDAVRFAGNELIDVIDRATQKGADFGQIMSDVFRNVAKQALQAAITGEGAFAKLFGTASSSGGVGGLGGLLVKAFSAAAGGGAGGTPLAGGAAIGQGGIGHMAGGGMLQPGGLAYVSEHGPDPKLIRNVGDRPLMVTPGDVQPAGGGGGGVALHMPVSIDARGAQIGVAEQIDAAMRQALAEVPGIVATMRRYDHRGMR